jgi:hypothetical protein
MNSRDTYELRTKEGCARVMVHIVTGIKNSYTVECGYYTENYNKIIPKRYQDE